MSLELRNTTLISVNGTEDISGTMKSMDWCLSKATFGNSILFSPLPPTDTNNNIHRVKIEPLDWIGYNRFIIKELYSYITTDFVLIVQEDGFIANPEMWSDEFANYDYLGAVWSYRNVKNSEWIPADIRESGKLNYVGNGGFSLRSKKLLKSCVDCPYEVAGPEDAYICNVHRDFFDEQGIRFAPPEIANRFSFEQWTEHPNENPMNHFGIHGGRLQ